MISFKAFVNAIHDAIVGANESFMEKSTDILDRFFVVSEDEEKIKEAINKAIRYSDKVSSQKGKADPEEFQKASEALGNVRKLLSEEGGLDKAGTLTAKSVVIEYPRQTPDGITYIDVHVPLITLVPLDIPQIDEAKLTAEFELEIVDDELKLNFGPRRSSGGKVFGKKSESTYGTLEIKISPSESSEGLKRLVEGYEKSLKSQIPH